MLSIDTSNPLKFCRVERFGTSFNLIFSSIVKRIHSVMSPSALDFVESKPMKWKVYFFQPNERYRKTT